MTMQAERSGGRSAPAGRNAAETAVGKHSTTIRTCVGTVTLPSADQLAFFAGVGSLAFFGLVEWPVAGALMIGHVLVQSRNNAMVREFGDALEQV